MAAKYIDTAQPPPGLLQTTQVLLPAFPGLRAFFIRRFSTFSIHLDIYVIFLLGMRAPLGVRIFRFPNNFTISDTVALL